MIKRISKRKQIICRLFKRSMFPCPRYHAQGAWARQHGQEIRAAARTLVRLLGPEYCQGEWRSPHWQHPWPMRPARRSEPRWFSSAPPRAAFPRAPERRRRVPDHFGNTSHPRDWQPEPPSVRPWIWKSRIMPRRGPPVAKQKVPRWYWSEEGETRQPRGVKPRGTLRGGPERTADDPRRNPRGGLCGGPGRSAKEPQTPFPKTSQRKSDRGRGQERPKTEKRPTVVTVEEGGRERTWGPLSRIAVWRAGCFWQDMQGAAKVFIKKDGKMDEVEVELRVEGGRERFWFNQKKDQPQHDEDEEPAL